MNPAVPSERRSLWMVFFVALSLIGLETVTFQALNFVNDHLRATQVLAVALMGISLGGVLAWVWPRGGSGVVLATFPLTLVATFPIVMWLNDRPFLMMALLTAPYVLASLFISRMFARLDPFRVYLFDLVGAGLSVLVVVVAVPQLREEGTFLLIGILGCVPLFLYGAATRRPPLTRTARILALAFATLLALHVFADPFNMIRWARADTEQFGRKIFNYWIDSQGDPRWRLLYSRGSLIERIDIVYKPDRPKRWVSVYNGRIVDSIEPSVARKGRLDNRLPTRLKTDPDTLLVGPSGQGLCKAVQALGDGHVDAVEINGAMARLMTGEMFERSGRAYDGMHLTIGDVRTFLGRTDRRYDYITLLNTRRSWSMGHQGPPEYIHTIEAMHAYFDQLKPDGFVLFEERNVNLRADLGIRRIVATASAALEERGILHPEDHYLIWELYHGCSKERWFSGDAPGVHCDRSKLFTFVMIKNSPVTVEEQAHLIGWAQQLGARRSSTGEYRGILWRYMPARPTDHYWTAVVRAERLADLPDADPLSQNLGIVTDDIPYGNDVLLPRTGVNQAIRTIAILSGAMVLLPAILAFVGTRRKGGRARRGTWLTTTLLVAFFGILGLGYLLVEVVLIQWFGIFLSSPVYSLLIVLGTMLVASGFGGLLASGWSRTRVMVAMALALVWLVLAAQAGPAALDALMGLPFLLRALAAAVMVTPLAMAMGMPFPHVLSYTRRRLSDRHAGLMFAINGALAAVAAPLALLLSMSQGFRHTLLVGCALYGICFVLLGSLPRLEASDSLS